MWINLPVQTVAKTVQPKGRMVFADLMDVERT